MVDRDRQVSLAKRPDDRLRGEYFVCHLSVGLKEIAFNGLIEHKAARV